VESYRSLEKNTQGQPYSVVSLAKWRILNRLHDRNETLYYRVSSIANFIFNMLKYGWNLTCFNWTFMSFPRQVLIDNIKDFAPIIYTPTVGLVCQNYSGLFRRPRGMYFSAKDKGEMMSMIYNWPAQQVLCESCTSVADMTTFSFCLSSLLELCCWQSNEDCVLFYSWYCVFKLLFVWCRLTW